MWSLSTCGNITLKAKLPCCKKSQNKPIIYLKYRDVVGFFVCLNCYFHQDIKIHFLFILLGVVVPDL